MRGFVIFMVLLAAGVTAAISLLTSAFPSSAPATEDLPRFGYNLALLFVVGSSIIVSFRSEFTQSVRSLAIWAAIFSVSSSSIPIATTRRRSSRGSARS